MFNRSGQPSRKRGPAGRRVGRRPALEDGGTAERHGGGGEYKAQGGPAAGEIVIGRLGEQAIVALGGQPFEQEPARGFLMAREGGQDAYVVMRSGVEERFHFEDDLDFGRESAGAAGGLTFARPALRGVVQEPGAHPFVGEAPERVECAVHAIGIRLGSGREEHADGVDHQQPGTAGAEEAAGMVHELVPLSERGFAREGLAKDADVGAEGEAGLSFVP